ncbi:ribbon-helix-helix protein, CopG family [Candidatus Gottesmanbacteria bacterium]|nr:ribbon-helix-helix protein, CopG family [Candidatus Gottesmanbacteria bacterium]
MSTFTISLPTQVAREVDTETQKQGFATRSEFIRALIRRYFSKELQFETFSPRSLPDIQKDLEKTEKYSDVFIKSIISGLKKSSVYEHQTTSS